MSGIPSSSRGHFSDLEESVGSSSEFSSTDRSLPLLSGELNLTPLIGQRVKYLANNIGTLETISNDDDVCGSYRNHRKKSSDSKKNTQSSHGSDVNL